MSADLRSTEYTAMDKTLQLAGRLAAIPTAISGLPAAITSLNYLKQIVVTKGLSYRFAKLVEEIRPGDVIWFPPNERHWHGASPTTAMTHIAIQEALDGKVVAERPLVALNAVEQGGFFKRLWDEFWMWWESE